MSTIRDRLHRLIEPYEYGKHDLLNRLDELTAVYSNNTLIIDHFFDYTPRILSGDCNELGVKLYNQISLINPRIPKRLVWGYDGEIFTQHTSAHCFVLVKDELGKEIVVDPSLKFVGELASSSYSVLTEERKDYTRFKLSNGRVSLHLDGSSHIVFVSHKENEIYYIGQNSLDTTDVLSLFRSYCIPTDAQSQFEFSPQQLSVRTQSDNPVFELAYRLNEHVMKQLE